MLLLPTHEDNLDEGVVLHQNMFGHDSIKVLPEKKNTYFFCTTLLQ
jgi:hypothetical protein